jgi:hypothetical protein
MSLATVPVEKTRNTCIGKNEPPYMFLKVTSSPATVKTLKSPPVPTYKTHPSLFKNVLRFLLY